ncbi:hypothetical protein EDC04DRAFT_2685344 [Pisolithus marmoratus]|nr:hypothetical protein EDC04DRAFT_2685344 [Pisolithus marmoratus]
MTAVLLSRAWSCSVFSVLLLERFEYPQNTRFPTCAHGPKNSYFQDGLRLEMNYAAFQNVAGKFSITACHLCTTTGFADAITFSAGTGRSENTSSSILCPVGETLGKGQWREEPSHSLLVMKLENMTDHA